MENARQPRTLPKFRLPVQLQMLENTHEQQYPLDFIPSHFEMQLEENGKIHEISPDTLECLGTLDRGTYGFVYKYRHRSSQFLMAIKSILVHNNSSGDPLDMRKRLYMDVVINQKIQLNEANQEYLIRSFGTLIAENAVWICMELMDTSLKKFYERVYGTGRRLPEEVMASILFSVVSGLHFLKDRLKIMHRDIKPSNIMMSKDGRVKICDFGISAELEKSLTKSNIGDQYYQAPERVDTDLLASMNEKGFDIRTDVWSLGITSMEIAMGQLPFRSTTVLGLAKEITSLTPPKLPRDLPYSLDFRDFVTACCQRDYSQRPRYAELLNMPFLAKQAANRHDISSYVQQVLDGASGDVV